MKFNPKLPSFILALNRESREHDLLAIRAFYKGGVAEMKGCWKGVEELSYQIPSEGVDIDSIKIAAQLYKSVL